MKNIEFFLSPDRKRIVYKGSSSYQELSQNDTEFINYLYYRIRDDYPEAFKRLQKIYGQMHNYKWMMVRRFVKCNFSVQDEREDITGLGDFILECVPCPLRDECADENVICNPQFNTTLSKRETEIVKLICEHFTDMDISDKLFISYHTVCNHRRKILKKLGVDNKAGIVDYAHKHNLICKR